MGFCLFKGDFGKIRKIGQPHPYTTARLIFLVHQANLGQVVRWGSHMDFADGNTSHWAKGSARRWIGLEKWALTQRVNKVGSPGSAAQENYCRIQKCVARDQGICCLAWADQRLHSKHEENLQEDHSPLRSKVTVGEGGRGNQ